MTLWHPRLATLCILLVTFTLGACSDGSDGPGADQTRPFQELYAQGIDRYLGRYTPMLAETRGESTRHIFGSGDGPLCQDGSSYSMNTRDRGAEDLLIFLQGGGACWSEFCLSTETAQPGIPRDGVLDPTQANNPMRDWNVAFVPYCDGGLHASDRDWGAVGGFLDGRRQRGLHNLSAALDVTANTFVQPRRIVLAGASAGGFGTIFALPLVRKLYPDTPIAVINDSGVGISREGDPDFIELLLADWNMEAFIPASCGRACYENGHLTSYFDWQLQQDASLRQGLMSYRQDPVIAVTFTQVGLPAFEQLLLREVTALETLQPQRVSSFITAGTGHTLLQSTLTQTAAGTTVSQWLQALIDGGDWDSARD